MLKPVVVVKTSLAFGNFLNLNLNLAFGTPDNTFGP
jgi:hypothetical protein